MDQSIRMLAEYIHGLRYESLPAQTVHEAKRRIIDTIGCAIGGYDAEPSRIARAVAGRYAGTPGARIFGSLTPTSLEHAAFANGAALRYLDFNDAYLTRSSGHPSDTLAAVFAVGEATGASGRDVLTAAACAYEVFCNFTDVLPREQGWDQVLHGVVATAAASAKLLGLDAAGIAQAISLAIVPNMPLEQTRTGELSMWKGVAAANASRNGVFAAVLAAAGMQGPGAAIEGRWGLRHAVGAFDWAPFGGAGGAFRIGRTMIKPFPAVIHAQSPATVALALRAQVALEEIDTIAIHTYWVANRYTDRAAPLWRPGTRETADHSIPYVVAAALIDGGITEATFDDAHLRDPRLRELLERTSVHEDTGFSAAYPERWCCRIEVRTRGGDTRSAAVEQFRGHPDNPMTEAELESKFRGLAAARLDTAACDAILAKLRDLDNCRNIAGVIDLLRW